MLQPTGEEGIIEGNVANWASRHQFSIAKYKVLPSIGFLDKLLHNLCLLYQGLLHENHAVDFVIYSKTTK
jgi:hypothetical protein